MENVFFKLLERFNFFSFTKSWPFSFGQNRKVKGTVETAAGYLSPDIEI